MGQIVIGADFVPTPSNTFLFESGEIESLFGNDLLSIIENASYRIFDLEVPLTNNKAPIKKCGRALIGNPEALNAYKRVQVNLLTLANNHILDQGVEGLLDTIKLLDKNKIQHVGAGKDVISAATPYIFELDSKDKFGVYACVEHEFSIAEENSPGANPYDPLESFDHVAELASKCDYVIVLYHGGKEFYRYPSPQLQKTCRKFIEKGAKLVITQHSHCIGCKEDYKDGTIVYGQGNFLFDAGHKLFGQTSLLVCINTSTFEVSYIPLERNNNTVRLAKGSAAEEILSSFKRRSLEIQEDGFIEKKYSEFAAQKMDYYLLTAHGIGQKSYFFRLANKLTGHLLQKMLIKKIYKQDQRLALQNCIECEAHRELFIRGIKNSLINNRF